ncbi:heterokaryon incompatibility protein-domain-containing protein [Microdochium trichocladiopsis]|uniref:Heterokaryon incompatibility protein-domain-containing protein n=1 Tax=Microdochium trichocladiopsis TaxID=1682393 RepID=A0A9P8YF37_9PEZI|nr:heterokaryon incompatibility protein-domain-containing protein [Microdochium trichocladiopsis]KAH7038285.1 heterokaryon incompatibility protein-domain-containing protein [Microdochium trichocladiopsis]
MTHSPRQLRGFCTTMSGSDSTVQPLCGYCSALFPLDVYAKPGSVSHHATVRDLLNCVAQTSCAICAEIPQQWPLDNVRKTFPDDGEDVIIDQTEIALSVDDGHRLVAARGRLGVLKPPDQIGWINLTLLLRSARHSYAHTMKFVIVTCSLEGTWSEAPAIWLAPSAGEVSHADKAKIIKSWLAECEHEHELCGDVPANVQVALPKRLVRIGNDSLRLVLTKAEAEVVNHIEYAALSHCWGSYPPLKTTKANLDRLSQDFAIRGTQSNDLIPPRTFREAVELCRALNIQYIWIDSLCIVQDDLEEWQAEATLMGSVYANAQLTIAASSAADSTEGCFPSILPDRGSAFHRRSRLITQFRAILSPGKVNNEEMPLSNAGAPRTTGNLHAVRVYPSRLGFHSTISNLRERGWALQEHVLSRRVVHCTYPELYWQCRSAYQTEGGVTIPPENSNREFLPIANQIEVAGDHDLRLRVAHNVWCRWMQDYSDRQFTIPSDRLAALAGMVDWMTQATGYTHLLACWEETICEDLAWLGRRWCAPTQRDFLLPNLPSWSWLSRGNEIEMGYQGVVEGDMAVDKHTLLVSKQILWEGLPLVSRLQHAELQLHGPLKQLRLTTDPEADYIHSSPLRINEGEHSGGPDKAWPGYDNGVLDTQPGDTEQKYLNGCYHCFLLFSLTESAGIRDFFLVLEPACCDSPNLFCSATSEQTMVDYHNRCFRRVGLAWTDRHILPSTSYFDDADKTTIRLV